MTRRASVAVRLSVAAALAVSSYIHADLYVSHGYRHIHVIGPAFLLQASAGFAVAALLLLRGIPMLRLAAAGVAVGALSGFVASRTVGVFGFVERGFTPSPDAAVSVIAEASTLLLLAWWQWKISYARSAPAVTLNATRFPLMHRQGIDRDSAQTPTGPDPR
jgi:hypothetical protein